MDQLLIPRVVLTTRCNFNCEYCAGPKQKIEEASVDTWLKVLNKPEYKKIIFTGGEPFLYKGINEIVARLNKPMEIYTNLELFDEDKHVVGWERVTFNVSLHDETTKQVKYKCFRLWGTERPISVHRVKGHAEEQAKQYEKYFDITVSEDQRDLPFNNKPHLCHINRVLFGPDAKRYPCCARMGEMEIGEGRYDGIYCRNPKCLPCDLFGKGN